MPRSKLLSIGNAHRIIGTKDKLINGSIITGVDSVSVANLLIAKRLPSAPSIEYLREALTMGGKSVDQNEIITRLRCDFRVNFKSRLTRLIRLYSDIRFMISFPLARLRTFLSAHFYEIISRNDIW